MTDVPHRKKALPLTQSILWVPAGAPAAPSDDTYHVFTHQRALHALHDHLRSSPDQGVLGFLLGHLYQDPQTSQRFAVIELVMRLTVAIYGDKTTIVVSRVWDKMQEELTRTGAQLLGWYHSHPPGGPEMAAGDLETHATYFGEPWHAALVLGSDERGPWAALYRPYRSGPDVGPPLAFYELLDPRSVTPDGKKRSSVRWMNYKPHKPSPNVSTGRSGPVPAVSVPEALPPPAPPEPLKFTPAPKPAQAPPPPAPAPPPLPPRSLTKEQVPVGFVDAKPAAAPPPPAPSPPPRAPAAAPPVRRARTSKPRFVLDAEPKSSSRLPLVAGLLAVVLLGGGAAWYFLAGPGAPRQSAAEPGAVSDTAPRLDSAFVDSAPGVMSSESVTAAVPSVTPPLDVPPPTAPAPETLSRAAVAAFDRVTDTLVAAIQSYQERARVYDARPDCGMLSRGLAQVERAWVAYNTEKRALTAQLDGDRTRRDLMLYSNVDTVQAHYDRTTCRRP